jgi:hypothetical protein
VIRKEELPPTPFGPEVSADGSEPLADPALIARLLSGGAAGGAAYLGVSERTLRRLFLRRGRRLSDVLKEIRKSSVADAMRSRRPSRHVAADLGFSSVANLYRFIRREFGMSVRDYRRLVRRLNVAGEATSDRSGDVYLASTAKKRP